MTAELLALTAELRSVQVVLSQLIDRLEDADRRAEALQASHDRLIRVVRWRRVESAVLLIAVVVLSVVSIDAYHSRHRICSSVRAGTVALVEALVNTAGQDPDPETQARIDHFRADVDAKLEACD